MKKLVYAIVALATLTLASCEKDPVGGTATEKMAGQWYVQAHAIDSAGNILFEDAYEVGNFFILTYNTADNALDSMFIQDMESLDGKAFWGFQTKVGCNQSAATFGAADGFDLLGGLSVDISDGKILYGAAHTPSGAVADSIVFNVIFSDDTYVGTYYDFLRVTGYRYTGLANDD